MNRVGQILKPSCWMLLTVAGTISCGDNTVSSCSLSGGHAIELVMPGEPTMLVFRADGGAWTEPSPGAPGRYQACAADEYVAIAVCADYFGTVLVSEYAATVDDGLTPVFSSCGGGAPVRRLEVSGLLEQGGGVFMDNTGIIRSSSEPWEFQLSVRPGTHTLVASNDYGRQASAGRVIVRREFNVLESTDLGTLDLDSEGSSMIDVPIIADGSESDHTIHTEVTMLADGEFAQVSTALGSHARVVPPDILASSDRQSIYFEESSSMQGDLLFVRSAFAEYVGGELRLALLPELSGITFTDGQAGVVGRWEDLPVDDFDRIDLVTDEATDPSRTQIVSATRRWLALHGIAEVGLDNSVPGFDPAWLIHSSAFGALALVRTVDGVEYSTSVTNDGALRVLRQFASHARRVGAHARRGRTMRAHHRR